MPDLQGTIAVVTGAGRGMALALGAAGATVYVTGRNVQGRATNNWPGTIDETPAAVTAAGDVDIPVRCDHTVDTEVAALFARVQREHGQLDMLVNNAWSGNALAIHADPFWELVLEHWQHMFTAGVRAAIVSSRYAVPLMLPQRQGLIMNISAWDRDKYPGHLLYDLAKQALNRLAYGMASTVRTPRLMHARSAALPRWNRPAAASVIKVPKSPAETCGDVA